MKSDQSAALKHVCSVALYLWLKFTLMQMQIMLIKFCSHRAKRVWNAKVLGFLKWSIFLYMRIHKEFMYCYAFSYFYIAVLLPLWNEKIKNNIASIDKLKFFFLIKINHKNFCSKTEKSMI